MLQLRSFIQQRLSAAAEEILGEVERTVSLALSGAQLHPPKEERHNEKLQPVQQTPGILESRGAQTFFPFFGGGGGQCQEMKRGLWGEKKNDKTIFFMVAYGLKANTYSIVLLRC